MTKIKDLKPGDKVWEPIENQRGRDGTLASYAVSYTVATLTPKWITFEPDPPREKEDGFRLRVDEGGSGCAERALPMEIDDCGHTIYATEEEALAVIARNAAISALNLARDRLRFHNWSDRSQSVVSTEDITLLAKTVNAFMDKVDAARATATKAQQDQERSRYGRKTNPQ